MSTFETRRPAEFRCSLPTGGMFYAAWAQAASEHDLKMASSMLTATLELWIDHAAQFSAGESEYLSWFNAAPTRSPQ